MAVVTKDISRHVLKIRECYACIHVDLLSWVNYLDFLGADVPI
jgi:hypothetical protein